MIATRFWNRGNGSVGLECAEIVTDYFSWKVTERQFEEIHGLSRVVRLLPEKLVTTWDVLSSLPDHVRQEDNGFFLLLVLSLLNVYQERESRNRALWNVPECCDRAFELTICDEVETRALSLSAGMQMLKDLLDEAVESSRAVCENRYWQTAEEITRLADRLREACQVYLDFVHPVLILSRRQNFDEVCVDEKKTCVIRLLETKKNFIALEFDRLRSQL